MRKKLKWLYIAAFAALLLSVGLYILSLRDKYQHLQDEYLEQALTHVGHVYVHKLNKYKADNGRYPDSLDALFANYISQRNLFNAYSSQLVLEEKYAIKDLTPEQKTWLAQQQAPKCSLWDDWGYELDENANTFKLYIVYECCDSSNTLEYSPELNDFFVTISLSVLP